MTPRSRLLLAFVLAPSLVGCAEEDEGYCDGQESWRAEWVAYEDEVLTIVNQHRAQGATCDGEVFAPSEPLSANVDLRCAARNHSADMAIRSYFSHDTPEGENFSDRVAKTDYAGFAQGENIAFGYASPTEVMTGWMASPGHCRNIMNPDHTQIGIGHYGEGLYWTQVMGRE